jgi:hypothetical protein
MQTEFEKVLIQQGFKKYIYRENGFIGWSIEDLTLLENKGWYLAD